MKKTIVFLGLVTLVSVCSAFLLHQVPTATTKDELNVCVSAEEMKLYNLLNEYRKSKGLHAIPLSKSLTFVAQTHANDLAVNKPTTGRCNMHSWSNKGDWSACCYTSDHAKAQCMWDKPRELTDYTGNGFEISFGGSYEVSAADAMRGWKGSSGHNSVMINKGIWKSWGWNAVGVGMKDGYAVIWFGKPKDAAGTPKVCN